MKLIRENGWGDRWTQFKPSYNWADGPLFGLDLETTSIFPNDARTVQCGIVLDEPDGEIHTFEWLINPGIEIPLNATAVHGINTDTVKEKGLDPAFAVDQIMQTLSNLKIFYPNAPLICVNAPYDITIIDRELRRYQSEGLSLDDLPFIVDTLTCDRKLDPWRIGRRTLTAVSAAYNIPISGAHDAINDVKCSIRLVRAMAKKYPEFATSDLAQLQEMQRVAHLEWIENYQEFRRLDDPEFTLAGSDWPMIPFKGK